jgi:hypothetical protein
MVADDGISHVIEVGNIGMIEQQRICQLTSISHNAVVADDHVLAKVGIMPNLTVAADNRRAFDHDAVFDHRPLPNEHLLSNKSIALALIVQLWAEIRSQVGLDFSQCLPRVLAAVEQGRMLSLA